MSTGTTDRARDLRRNATDAERRLWSRLRNRQVEGAKFRRQVPIASAIADFACIEARLVVEVDGGQHAEAIDAPRTARMEAAGYRVIRFWNHDVLANTDGVIETIATALGAAPLTPTLSPAGRGGHVAPRNWPMNCSNR